MTTNEICNMQNYLDMSSREIKYIKNIAFKHVNGSIIQNYAINKDMTFNNMFEELKKKFVMILNLKILKQFLIVDSENEDQN